VPLDQWLKLYPATGYVVTAKPGLEAACIEVFEKAGITAAIAGEITSARRLEIRDGGKKACVFDFERDIITGIQ
jgi:hypothetical protein